MTSPDQPPRDPPRPDRPGAMTAAMQAVGARPKAARVLRIGIVHGGAIVEEQTFRWGEAVTIGSSEQNRIAVQGEGVPARFELFRPVGDEYVLNLTDGMSGRLSQAGTILDLDPLRQVRLDGTSRGKLVIAGTTLLFQFVVAPPVRPHAQLPAAVRTGFVRRIDWLFAAFLVTTFTTMLGFIVYLDNADWPVSMGLATLDEEFAFPIFVEPIPPAPPPDESKDAEQPLSDSSLEAPTEKPRAEPKPRTEHDSTPPNDAQPAEKAARIAEQASKAAEALVVGALGTGADSAILDVLAGGAVPGSAAEILSSATGVEMASSRSDKLRDRSGGLQGSGQRGLDALAARGGSSAIARKDEGPDVVEAPVRGSTRLGSGGDIAGSGHFEAAIVVQRIKAQISAIKACYERELKRDPTLAGKVAVEFTIEERGTVSGVTVTDNTTGNAAVGKCVADTIQRFRFSPGPEGGSVTFSYPFVFAPQG